MFDVQCMELDFDDAVCEYNNNVMYKDVSISNSGSVI